jgi:hypothetical protein
LQVGILGGGGFFSLQLAPPAKIVQVEGAFEFGGCFAIDLGVASGRVYLLAGIYFRIAGSCVEVEGYVRCGGALDILGLITVSVEFFMGLKFLDKPDGYYLTGRATVTVSIELLFFSASVSLSVERTFLGHQKEQASLGPHDACSEAELREHFAAFGIG